MNLFFIARSECNREALSELRRIAHLLSAMGEARGACILTGFDREQLAYATEAQTVLLDAEVIPTMLCSVCGPTANGYGFEQVCLQCELLLERMLSGSLANKASVIVIASEETVRGMLQAAFHLPPSEALALALHRNSVRWLRLVDGYFFDLGELPEPTANGEMPTSPMGDFCGGVDDQQEKDQEKACEPIVHYFSSEQSRQAAVCFVKTVIETVKNVRTVIERRTEEWSYGMQRPIDYVRNNDLRLLCALMEHAADLMRDRMLMLPHEQALGQGQAHEQAPLQEQEENYGIEPEQSREPNGKTHGIEMQNSK